MGELRAVFDTMKKEREERRKSLEPSRVQYATDLLIEAWYAVAWDARKKQYTFTMQMIERIISQNYIHIKAGGQVKVLAQDEVFIN